MDTVPGGCYGHYMHEVNRQVLVALPTVMGIDFSITNEVVLIWLAALVTFVVVLAARRRGPVAHGFFSNMFEALTEIVEKEIVQGALGKQGSGWAPFLLSLFFFILFSNLLGMLPLPNHTKAMTSSLSVTAGLALMVFCITIVVSIHKHGLLGFLRKFIPRGIHPAVAVLVFPIEVISWIAKPASLAIRLFANMLAGHALILVFIGLLVSAPWFMRPLPLVGAIAMSCFELFICFIQALVFTMLTGIYIREALEEH